MTKNPNDTFTVFSSHGEITARCMDGTVTELNLNLETWGEELPVQFDIEEWERHYTKSIEEVSGVDILDIGYWYYSNKLHVLDRCPPCDVFRREMRFETLERVVPEPDKLGFGAKQSKLERLAGRSVTKGD